MFGDVYAEKTGNVRINISVLNFFQRKTAKTTACKIDNHLDSMSNSGTAIDFSVDLGEFDINTFPEEIRKLHEEGKLKKLLKHAIGLKRHKTGVSSILCFWEQRYFSFLIFDITMVKLKKSK